MDSKNIVIKIIEGNECMFRCPSNKNMCLTYPFTQIIKNILLYDKKHHEHIYERITGFFNYERNNSKSLYNKVDKGVFIKKIDEITNARIWEKFIDLFDRGWDSKSIEEWIMCDTKPIEIDVEKGEATMEKDINYKKITKKDLEEGDLVKTQNDSWLVCYKNGEKILRSTTKPPITNSLENYTDELIDVRRFLKKEYIDTNSFEDIIAIRKYNSETSDWDYSRENELSLLFGFKKI